MLDYNNINSNDKSNKYLSKSYNIYPNSYDYINYFFFNRRKKLGLNSKNNYKNLPSFVNNTNKYELKLKSYVKNMVDFIFRLIKYKNIEKYFFLKYRSYKLIISRGYDFKINKNFYKNISMSKKKMLDMKKYYNNQRKFFGGLKKRNRIHNKKYNFYNKNYIISKNNLKLQNILLNKIFFLKKKLFEYLNMLNNKYVKTYIKPYYYRFNKILDLLFKEENKNNFITSNNENNIKNICFVYYNNFSNIFYKNFEKKLYIKFKNKFKNKSKDKLDNKLGNKLDNKLNNEFNNKFENKFKTKLKFNLKKKFRSGLSKLVVYKSMYNFFLNKHILNSIKKKNYILQIRKEKFQSISTARHLGHNKLYFFKKKIKFRMKIKKFFKRFKKKFRKIKGRMWRRHFALLDNFRNLKLHRYIRKIMYGLISSKGKNMIKALEKKTYHEVEYMIINLFYKKTKKRKKVRKARNIAMKKRKFRRYRKKVNSMIVKNQLLYKEKNNISDLKLDNFKNVLKNNLNYFNNSKLSIINEDIILNFFNYYNNEYLLKNYLKNNYYKMNNYFSYLIIKRIYNLKSRSNLLKYFYTYLYNNHRNNNIFLENKLTLNRLLYKKQFKYILIEKLNILKNKISNYICNFILMKNKNLNFLNFFLFSNINYDFQFNLFILILCNNIVLSKLKKLK